MVDIKNIESPLNKRIFNNFCCCCKYKKHLSDSGCSLFISKDCICDQFEFETNQARKNYEEETLHNWAVTIWLNKGKSLEDIYKMPKEEFKKVLANHHYMKIKKKFSKE